VFIPTTEEDLFQRETLKYSWLSIHIRDPMMKRRSGISRTWNLHESKEKKNMKIPRNKEEPEELVILSRITRLPA
jgi:hypothetical protein